MKWLAVYNDNTYLSQYNEDGTENKYENIVADTTKYVFDIVVVLIDGTQWQFVLDYNLVFAQPATREI